MAVPTTLADLSPTLASNSPAGTDAIGTNLDDYIRAGYGFISQLHGATQTQLYTAFTTGGTATAFTLTPTPASAGNATNQRFRVKFNAAAGATPTLAVSGQTAKDLKYYDSTGAKQAVTSTQIPENWISDVEYDGTDWVVLDIPQISLSAVAGIGNGRATDITISSAGEVTMPLQPAFLAYNSATDSNVTGDNTAYTVVFDTEVFDQNADYNNGTGVFTAPVTGLYRFSVSVLAADVAAGHVTHNFSIVTSNRTYAMQDIFPAGANPFVSQRSFTLNELVDMDSGDTAYVSIQIAGATKVVDVYGGAIPFTRFSGELVA